MPTKTAELDFDPPPTGRKGDDLRIRRMHPLFAKHINEDPLTMRLIVLAHGHPEVASISADEIVALDRPSKEALLAKFERAMGLDSAAQHPGLVEGVREHLEST